MKPKIFWNYLRNKKNKDVKIKKEIDFKHLESEILEMEKNVVTNKELKFAFAQPTNWDNFFSDEDDSESQEVENDSRSQVSQREHLINKTQDVWVNEEFEDDLDNSQSVKKKIQIVLIKLKNLNKYDKNNSHERSKKRLKMHCYLKKFKILLKYLEQYSYRDFRKCN